MAAPVSDRVFIDTNVFVYANDADQPEKRAIARSLITRLSQEDRAVVSTQVLNEYVAVARRKLKLSFADCRQAVLLMCRLEVVITSEEHVLGAIDLASVHSLSYWDALMIRAASAAGCRRLVSEDLNHSQVVDGVRIENPFRER